MTTMERNDAGTQSSFSIGSLLTGLGNAGMDAGKAYLNKRIGTEPKAATDRQAQAVAATPGFNVKWLYIGGVALVVVVLLFLAFRK